MENKNLSPVELVSLVIGIASIVLSVYLTKDTALQIGFAITIALSVMIVFLYNNNNRIDQLSTESKARSDEFKDLKEKLDIYSRLSKIEHKLFEEGGKMNKKGQGQYLLVIVLVLVFLFLIYLAFFKG